MFVGRKTLGVAETKRGYVVFASSIGLKPGQWPFEIETDVGSRRPFRRAALMKDGSGVRYRQEGGAVLDVIND